LVIQTIKLTCCSTKGWQEAAEEAVLRACKTVSHMKEFHVELGGLIEDCRTVERLAEVTLASEVEK